MVRVVRLLAPALLLLALACQPQAPAPVYGPWEEGLTLAYEDPTLPQPQRAQDRLQVRVAKATMAPGQPRLVQLDLTSIRGAMTAKVQHQGGGQALLGEDDHVLSQLLPLGFPTTSAWTERGTEFRVVGRATWSGAALLPRTADPVGIWVEAKPDKGPRRRTLYLPNFGEVESIEERGTQWVTVNRLVAQGYTDLPAIKRR